MSVIASNGLSLLVGDGATTEIFTPLKGAVITRLELAQRGVVSNAIGSDAWQVQVGAANRKLVLECEAYATDEAPAQRLRTLALTGGLGNLRLKLSPMETLQCAALVVLYREVIAAGEVKKLVCRVESSGAVLVV